MKNFNNLRFDSPNIFEDYREICPCCKAKILPEKIKAHILSHENKKTACQIQLDKPKLNENKISKQSNQTNTTQQNKNTSGLTKPRNDRLTIEDQNSSQKILCPLCGQKISAGNFKKHKQKSHGEAINPPSSYSKRISRSFGKDLPLRIFPGGSPGQGK
jgi:DNA repair exonuclease SbcCD ATPase subunit